MTFKQFKQWCNDRACDGCWDFGTAKYCVELLDNMNQIPWWRRKKIWNKIANRLEFAVVAPINKKFKMFMEKGKTMNRLKPCPFCGTTPKGQMNFYGVRVYITEDGKRFYVQCDNCGARTAEKITHEKAEAVWNWRVDAKPSEIDFDYEAEDGQ